MNISVAILFIGLKAYVSLKAKDKGGLETEMKIEVYIKDENDNKPTCDRANLIVRKRFENITLQHLKDICHDDDIGEENQITGFLLQTNDCGSNGRFIKFMPYLSRIRKKQQVSFHYIF